MFKLFSPSKKIPRKKRALSKAFDKFRPRLQVEQLENRVVLSNDFYVVPGDDTEEVAITFHWDSRNADFNNELGVFEVDDTNGTTVGIDPSDDNYAPVAITGGMTIFRSGETAGAQRTVLFDGGTILGFYLIQATNTDIWVGGNNNNQFGGVLALFSFSDNGPNPNNFDPVKSFNPDSSNPDKEVFFYDDWGGKIDHNDMIFTVELANNRAEAIPAAFGETISADFTIESNNGFVNFTEVGIFRVENLFGQIGDLFPGDDGFTEQALDTVRTAPLFEGFGVGAETTVFLPGSEFFGFYAIRGGTREQFLDINPSNVPSNGPLAFFSFHELNPGFVNVFSNLGNRKFALESLVFSVEFGVAPQITAQLENDTAQGGGTNMDGITSDSSITGTLTREEPIVSFTASINSEDEEDFVNILDTIQNGTFRIDDDRMDTIFDEINETMTGLPDGDHILRLQARDAKRNSSAVFELPFTLDTMVELDPTMSLNLDRDFDSGTLDDGITNFDLDNVINDGGNNFIEVTLTGTVEPGSIVILEDDGGNELGMMTADDNGIYSFEDIRLNVPTNPDGTVDLEGAAETIFTIQVEDIAGNMDSLTRTFTVSNENPTVSNTIANFTVDLADPDSLEEGRFIDLSGFFSDPDINNSLVRLFTNSDVNGGIVDVELFDVDTPIHAANFLEYIRGAEQMDGSFLSDYADTFFHRSTDPAVENIEVLQGGGFGIMEGAMPGDDTTLTFVDTDEPIENESGIPNNRGTIGQARGGDPDSGTSQFYFNLADNSLGGFTVFGEVVNGLDALDDLGSIPTRNEGGFPTLPLDPDFTGDFPEDVTAEDLAFVNDAEIIRQVEALTYTVSVMDGNEVDLVEAAIDQGHRVFFTYDNDDGMGGLKLDPGESDTVTITITATDRGGRTIEQVFDITVENPL